MSVCVECGKGFSGKKYSKGLCQGCYNYFRRGGTRHELPPLGAILRDDRGYIICHICGKAYLRLGSHARMSHNMTIAEYKKKFGLCNKSRTTEDTYSTTMHNHAVNNGMPQRMVLIGRGTRVKPGETKLRKGKKTRLQETIAKKQRKGKNCDRQKER